MQGYSNFSFVQNNCLKKTVPFLALFSNMSSRKKGVGGEAVGKMECPPVNVVRKVTYHF